MRKDVKPETLDRVERSVPFGKSLPSLEVWHRSGGLSHQHVKNALKTLVDSGRMLRTRERFKPVNALGTRERFLYRRVAP